MRDEKCSVAAMFDENRQDKGNVIRGQGYDKTQNKIRNTTNQKTNTKKQDKEGECNAKPGQGHDSGGAKTASVSPPKISSFRPSRLGIYEKLKWGVFAFDKLIL